MSSPFPGMDPYLEHPTHWSDFHHTFISCWRDALRAALPPHYLARIQEHVYLFEGPPVSQRTIYPDVAIERQRRAVLPGPQTVVAEATLAPVSIPLIMPEEVPQAYIEILHRPDKSLVASLELLSPANKEEPGFTAHVAKRNAVLRQNVHLVELDLLRAGRRPALRAERPPGDYSYLIARSDHRPDGEVYSWPLPSPLPKLPVPLRAADSDVIIDYALLFGLVCERGGYIDEIDYAQPPQGPLSDDTLKWMSQLLSPDQPPAPSAP